MCVFLILECVFIIIGGKWEHKLISAFLLQAGTQFWDENLQNELAEGRLSSTAFDRWGIQALSLCFL